MSIVSCVMITCIIVIIIIGSIIISSIMIIVAGEVGVLRPGDCLLLSLS